MKKSTVVALFCSSLVAYGNAQAQATPTKKCVDLDTSYVRLGVPEIIDAISGKRIEATTPVGVTPPEEWNEDHCALPDGGALYKVGVSVNDPVDPRAYRGVWGVASLGGASVQYNYRPSGTIYNWSLWKNGSDDLCWQDTLSGDERAIAIDPAPQTLIDDIDPGLDCSVP